MTIDVVYGALIMTLALRVHGTLGRPHATVERPHANPFHVAEVHCVSHGLFVHPLHGLKEGRTSNIFSSVYDTAMTPGGTECS